MEWFCQICLAVQHLHDNRIIHRDIKVHNIFLTSSGLVNKFFSEKFSQILKVKLGDFGISKQLENSSDLSQTQIGTPLYLTPEMVMSSTSSNKSDIWMLGCLLHELCSLEKPFKGESFPVRLFWYHLFNFFNSASGSPNSQGRTGSHSTKLQPVYA